MNDDRYLQQQEVLLNAGERILNSGKILSMERSDLNGILQDCVRILNSDGGNRLKETYMNILYRAAFREDMSLEECWQIFRDIDRAMFVNYALCLRNGSLRELYGLIFDFVQSQIDYSGKTLRVNGTDARGRGRDRGSGKSSQIAVVTTSQLLRLGHAPTRRVLDYSYALSHELGYRVVIINDGGMHYYHCDSLGKDIDFTFLEEYSDKTSIEYRGERFELLQVGALMPDLSVIRQLVDMIYDLHPAFVYNIGASSLVSDLCDCFVPVYSQACNTNLPVSMCSNLLLCRELETYEGNENLRANQRVIETVYNFSFAESESDYEPMDFIMRCGGLGTVCEANESTIEKLSHDITSYATREEMGEKFFAATVGYRIGDELDEDFINLLGRALAEIPSMYMFVVGEIREDAPIRAIIERTIEPQYRKRLIFTGALQGAVGLVKHMKLVLNPDRSGGGRSIFEANYCGIPSISLRKGDGYYAGGVLSGADDYDEYLNLIKQYCSDRDFYLRRSGEARKRACGLEDIAGALRKVIG